MRDALRGSMCIGNRYVHWGCGRDVTLCKYIGLPEKASIQESNSANL